MCPCTGVTCLGAGKFARTAGAGAGAGAGTGTGDGARCGMAAATSGSPNFRVCSLTANCCTALRMVDILRMAFTVGRRCDNGRWGPSEAPLTHRTPPRRADARAHLRVLVQKLGQQPLQVAAVLAGHARVPAPRTHGRLGEEHRRVASVAHIGDDKTYGDVRILRTKPGRSLASNGTLRHMSSYSKHPARHDPGHSKLRVGLGTSMAGHTGGTHTYLGTKRRSCGCMVGCCRSQETGSTACRFAFVQSQRCPRAP